MYAKIFSQIYDGTLCTNGPWEALVTFQQLLILADQEGGVDMTIPAIARRTTIPREILERGIEALMLPDPESRTPTEEGRRIVPLSNGRSWGWRVVNYEKYRQIKREQDRRDYHRDYYHKRKSEAVNTTQHDSTIQPIAEAEAKTEAKTEAKAEEEAKTKKTPRKRGTPAAPSVVSSVDLVADGLSQELADGFLQHRSALKAKLTPMAWKLIKAEATEAGISPAKAAEEMIARGWRGLKADWLRNLKPAAGQRGKPMQTEAERKAAQQQVIAEAKRMMGFAGAAGDGEVFEGEALERF